MNKNKQFEEIYKAKKKPTSLFTLPRVVAAAIVLIMFMGMFFVPNLFHSDDSGFIIVANAKTLDITVTKSDGSIETKTLQFRYNPVEITEADNYLDNQILTPSVGTISAKLITE